MSIQKISVDFGHFLRRPKKIGYLLAASRRTPSRQLPRQISRSLLSWFKGRCGGYKCPCAFQKENVFTLAMIIQPGCCMGRGAAVLAGGMEDGAIVEAVEPHTSAMGRQLVRDLKGMGGEVYARLGMELGGRLPFRSGHASAIPHLFVV
jgi:hypothetical protein